jgi:hypothetical protein
MRSICQKLLPAICAVALLVAVPAAAQAQIYLFADAGVVGYGGEDLDGINAGFGAEGGIGTRLGSSFSLSGVFGWSTHGTSSDVSLPCVECASGTPSVSQISIMARPLIHFGGDNGGADFFVGAHGGYTSMGPSGEKVNGLIIGPVAGVGFPMGDSGSFGVGGNYSALSLSDDVNGSTWGAVAFITFGLGGGN